MHSCRLSPRSTRRPHGSRPLQNLESHCRFDRDVSRSSRGPGNALGGTTGHGFGRPSPLNIRGKRTSSRHSAAVPCSLIEPVEEATCGPRTEVQNGDLDGKSRHQYLRRSVEAALDPTLDPTAGWIHTRYTTSELAPDTTPMRCRAVSVEIFIEGPAIRPPKMRNTRS